MTTRITAQDILDGTITDADIATANKDGSVGTASMRTLGTGAAQAAAGNHDHAGVYQPVDSDLTAIAALTTTAYGRAFLALADAAAGRTALALGTAATSASTDFQPIDSDLTAIAALTTTAFGRSVLAAADAAALQTLAGTVIGTNVQAFDADLTSIAALSTATYGRSLLTLASAIAQRNGGAREPNLTTADDSITAGTSVHIAGDYEIGSGFDTEAGLNTYLEVT